MPNMLVVARISDRRALSGCLLLLSFFLPSIAVSSAVSFSVLPTSDVGFAESSASLNEDSANDTGHHDADGGPGSVDVVFMGDSITEFWAQPRFGGFFSRRNYANRGMSGQATSHMLSRFRQDVIGLKPKIVVILAGTNDIAGGYGPTTNETIEGNLASMSEMAKSAGIGVILASILPVAASQTTARPMTRIREINNWLRSYAKANNCVYLDYFSAMIDSQGFLRAGLSDDGLHPNANGYALMEPMVETAIAMASRSRSR